MKKTKMFNYLNVTLITVFLIAILAIVLVPSVNASSTDNDIELKYSSEVKAEAYIMGHVTVDCQTIAEMEAIRAYNY